MHRQTGQTDKGRNRGNRKFDFGDQIAIFADGTSAAGDHIPHIVPRNHARDQPQKERIAVHIAALAQSDGKREPEYEDQNRRTDHRPCPAQHRAAVCFFNIGFCELDKLLPIREMVTDNFFACTQILPLS